MNRQVAKYEINVEIEVSAEEFVITCTKCGWVILRAAAGEKNRAAAQALGGKLAAIHTCQEPTPPDMLAKKKLN